MKPRRVTVTLELETDVVVSLLRKAKWWNHHLGYATSLANQVIGVHQAQVNVIKKKTD